MMEMLRILTVLLSVGTHLTKPFKLYILKMGTFYHVNSISINLICFKNVFFPADSIDKVKSTAYEPE